LECFPVYFSKIIEKNYDDVGINAYYKKNQRVFKCLGIFLKTFEEIEAQKDEKH
tara:strand:+ start:414 stop:575 length:162 start_codon:yes stop_codon:yes gene_type:complete